MVLVQIHATLPTPPGFQFSGQIFKMSPGVLVLEFGGVIDSDDNSQ
jgi:hypothetical protein